MLRISSEVLAMESDLNFVSLLETTLCLIKAYIIWMYIRFVRLTKIDSFVRLVKLIHCNVKAKINNNYSQRNTLLQWIRSKIKEPIRVNNFTHDWKNGIALCALVEALVPGSCPRYDLLNPNQGIDNLNLALSLIKKHLKIDSLIESEEIFNCTEEAKLVYLLSRVKMESRKLFMKSLLKRPIIQVTDTSGNTQRVFESLFGEEMACFAKGMGLILGVRTRRARFNIFCKPSPKLNLIIEISGPNNTMCSERITVHNPKIRMSAEVVTHSLIADYLNRKKTTDDIMKIPFFYEILSDKIVVTYIPLMTGIHKLSIIWQGQHILNSPYTVKVEECTAAVADDKTASITSPNRLVPGFLWPVPTNDKKKTLSLDDCATVKSRKVLKKTIVVNGRQTVINDFTNNTKSNPKTIDYTNDLEFGINSTKNNIKNNISNKTLNQRKLEKLIINSYDDSNVSDIKENNSTNPSNKMIEFDKMYGSGEEIRQLTHSTNNNIIANKCDNQQIKSVVDSEDRVDRMDRPETSNKYQVSNTDIHLRVNNANNRSYLPVIPVKNMIQNWEIKLSKNVNEIKEKDFKEKPSTKLITSSVPVKDRLEVFEKNNITILENNREISSSLKSIPQNMNDEQTVEDRETVCVPNTSEEAKDDHIIDEPDIKSGESQPDSGICSHVYAIPDNKPKPLRHKSKSYPNLNNPSVQANHYQMENQIEKNERIGETQASTYSGQYIDDEIPDYSNLFLGRYVSYTGLLNSDVDFTYDDINFNNILDIESELNSTQDQSVAQDLGIYPEKCEVIGAGAYYGQVSTKDGGRSYLAVGVQSAETDDVIEVSFTSISQNRYEVHYQVSRPGYYVIFVKWGDYNIADSPFICKVTF